MANDSTDEKAVTNVLSTYEFGKKWVWLTYRKPRRAPSRWTWGRLLEAFGSHDVSNLLLHFMRYRHVASRKLVMGYNLLGFTHHKEREMMIGLKCSAKDYTLMLMRVLWFLKVRQKTAEDAGIFFRLFIIGQSARNDCKRKACCFQSSRFKPTLMTLCGYAPGPTGVIELISSFWFGPRFMQAKKTLYS